MQKRELLIVLALLVFLLPFTAAATVQIGVQTNYPNHGIIISVQNASTGSVIDSVYSQTDENGNVMENYDTPHPELKFKMYLMLQGVVVDSKEFDAVSTGAPVILELINESKSTQPTTTSTDTLPSPIVAENSTQSKVAPVSGNAVEGEEESKGSLLIYFILLAVAIGCAAGYFIYMGFNLMNQMQARQVHVGAIYKAHGEQVRQTAQGPFQFIKTMFAQQNQPKPQQTITTVTPISSEFDRQIEEANQKIKTAQQEMLNLKKKEELIAAQKRLAATQRELERARQITEREAAQMQQQKESPKSQDPLNRVQKL